LIDSQERERAKSRVARWRLKQHEWDGEQHRRAREVAAALTPSPLTAAARPQQYQWDGEQHERAREAAATLTAAAGALVAALEAEAERGDSGQAGSRTLLAALASCGQAAGEWPDGMASSRRGRGQERLSGSFPSYGGMGLSPGRIEEGEESEAGDTAEEEGSRGDGAHASGSDEEVDRCDSGSSGRESGSGSENFSLGRRSCMDGIGAYRIGAAVEVARVVKEQGDAAREEEKAREEEAEAREAEMARERARKRETAREVETARRVAREEAAARAEERARREAVAREETEAQEEAREEAREEERARERAREAEKARQKARDLATARGGRSVRERVHVWPQLAVAMEEEGELEELEAERGETGELPPAVSLPLSHGSRALGSSGGGSQMSYALPGRRALDGARNAVMAEESESELEWAAEEEGEGGEEEEEGYRLDGAALSSGEGRKVEEHPVSHSLEGDRSGLRGRRVRTDQDSTEGRRGFRSLEGEGARSRPRGWRGRTDQDSTEGRRGFRSGKPSGASERENRGHVHSEAPHVLQGRNRSSGFGGDGGACERACGGGGDGGGGGGGGVTAGSVYGANRVAVGQPARPRVDTRDALGPSTRASEIEPRGHLQCETLHHRPREAEAETEREGDPRRRGGEVENSVGRGRGVADTEGRRGEPRRRGGEVEDTAGRGRGVADTEGRGEAALAESRVLARVVAEAKAAAAAAGVGLGSPDGFLDAIDALLERGMRPPTTDDSDDESSERSPPNLRLPTSSGAYLRGVGVPTSSRSEIPFSAPRSDHAALRPRDTVRTAASAAVVLAAAVGYTGWGAQVGNTGGRAQVGDTGEGAQVGNTRGGAQLGNTGGRAQVGYGALGSTDRSGRLRGEGADGVAGPGPLGPADRSGRWGQTVRTSGSVAAPLDALSATTPRASPRFGATPHRTEPVAPFVSAAAPRYADPPGRQHHTMSRASRDARATRAAGPRRPAPSAAGSTHRGNGSDGPVAGQEGSAAWSGSMAGWHRSGGGETTPVASSRATPRNQTRPFPSRLVPPSSSSHAARSRPRGEGVRPGSSLARAHTPVALVRLRREPKSTGGRAPKDTVGEPPGETPGGGLGELPGDSVAEALGGGLRGAVGEAAYDTLGQTVGVAASFLEEAGGAATPQPSAAPVEPFDSSVRPRQLWLSPQPSPHGAAAPPVSSLWEQCPPPVSAAPPHPPPVLSLLEQCPTPVSSLLERCPPPVSASVLRVANGAKPPRVYKTPAECFGAVESLYSDYSDVRHGWGGDEEEAEADARILSLEEEISAMHPGSLEVEKGERQAQLPPHSCLSVGVEAEKAHPSPADATQTPQSSATESEEEEEEPDWWGEYDDLPDITTVEPADGGGE